MSEHDDYIEEEEPYPEEYPEDEYFPEDEMETNDGYEELSKSTTIKRTRSYDVLSVEMVEKKTTQTINEVIETLGLPTRTAATTLLRHFKWDVIRLIQEYTGAESEEEQQKILRAAGITTFELEKILVDDELDKNFECLICLDTVLGKDTFALSCEHRYCRNCWVAYIEFVIKNDASCIWTRCPFPKCNELVHENAFKIFATPELYAVYDKYLNRSIVLENPVAKFCPAPNCSNAIQAERANRASPVICDCGFHWCFVCSDYEIGDHIPAVCDDIESWKQKASDESENVKWMVANTKKCPHCRSAIEKNGGCMHMTCRKEAGGCGSEFCWLCRGDWKEHGSHTGGYYNCNKYEASNAKNEDDSAAKLKTELERYQFFYTRFEAHRDAMKIASKQLENCEIKAGELQKHFRVRPEDTTFLRGATETLIRNRGILKNSYIYGFYITKKPTSKQLFEYSQEQLEKFTNRLSELYERTTESIKNYDEFIQWKNETIKFTNDVENYRKRFVQDIIEANNAI